MKLILWIQFSVICSFVCLNIWAANLVAPNFDEAKKGINQFLKGLSVKPAGVLIAFDIDDTLISPVAVMGSELWFNWQDSLIKSDSKDSGRLAADFDSLLTLQNRLLGLIRFQSTESSIPSFISELQGKGYGVIACTSRGPAEVTSTLRELKSNGIDLEKSAFAKKSEVYEPYLPYQLSHPSAGYLAEEFAKLEKPRNVSLVDGVYFTEGQNKGVMLRALLNRSKMPIGALVFVDNRLKHTDRVDGAFQGRAVKVFTVHYKKVDIDTIPMQAHPELIEAAHKEWESLKRFVE